MQTPSTTNKKEPASLNQSGRIKFLLGDSIVYGGAHALNTLFMMMTVPFVTRHYSVADFGLIDALSVLVNLFALACVFGQDSALARYFYEFPLVDKKKIVVGNSLLIQLSVLLLIFPLMWYGADIISRVYLSVHISTKLLRYVLLQVPVLLLTNFAANLLKWTFAKYQFLLINIGSSVVALVALVVGVLFYNINLQDYFLILLIVRIFFAILAIFFVLKWIVFKPEAKLVKKLLLFAIPLGAISVTDAVLPAIDRLLISRHLTVEMLGIYSIAFKVALLIDLPIQSFQTAWGPFALSIYKKNDAEETFNTVLNLYVMIICSFALLLIFFTDIGTTLLASGKYDNSGQYVLPIVLGKVILSISWVTTLGISLSKKPHYQLYSYITQLVVSVIITLVFINTIALFAVTIGYLMSQVALVLMETSFAYRLHPLRFQLKKAFSVFIILVIAASGYYFTRSLVLPWRISVLSIITILFFVSIYAIGIGRQNPLKLLNQMFE